MTLHRAGRSYPAGYANRPGGGQCDSCGAPIRWETTAKNGKAIPLNTTPDERGNVVLRRDDAGRLRAYVLSKSLGPEDDETRYMPHHATCPRPRGFHRPRRD